MVVVTIHLVINFFECVETTISQQCSVEMLTSSNLIAVSVNALFGSMQVHETSGITDPKHEHKGQLRD